MQTNNSQPRRPGHWTLLDYQQWQVEALLDGTTTTTTTSGRSEPANQINWITKAQIWLSPLRHKSRGICRWSRAIKPDRTIWWWSFCDTAATHKCTGDRLQQESCTNRNRTAAPPWPFFHAADVCFVRLQSSARAPEGWRRPGYRDGRRAHLTLQHPVDLAAVGQPLQVDRHGRQVDLVLLQSLAAAAVQLDGPLRHRA